MTRKTRKISFSITNNFFQSSFDLNSYNFLNVSCFSTRILNWVSFFYHKIGTKLFYHVLFECIWLTGTLAYGELRSHSSYQSNSLLSLYLSFTYPDYSHPKLCSINKEYISSFPFSFLSHVSHSSFHQPILHHLQH